jgi:predicted RNA-binding Zn ribbon-like protein
MPLDPAAIQTVNRIADRANLQLRFDEHGELRPTTPRRGLAAALGGLLAAVADAQAQGTWRRLKACREPGCHWVFYDTSRNAAGVWCSMSVCGSRSKMRTYRRRQQQRG